MPSTETQDAGDAKEIQASAEAALAATSQGIQPFFQSGPSGPFGPLANCKGPLGNRWSAPIGDSAVTQYRLLKHQYRWHISWKKGWLVTRLLD